MISPELLISLILSLDSLNISGSDKTFDVYIHGEEGSASVANGTALAQDIATLAPTESLLSHANDQFSRISSIADVHFRYVDIADNADISIFIDQEIDIGDDSVNTLGLTLSNFNIDTGRQWFEIFLNGPLLSNASLDLEAYVFNHELLHALGLEHAFDDSDGDFYLSTDPQLSAMPEETVMSYRPPSSGIYPRDLSESDYNALTHIWGASSTSSNINNGDTLVYRLYDQQTQKHFYTANSEEIDILTGNQSRFVNEGVAYSVDSTANQQLYRFYHIHSGQHFYSASDSERDVIVSSTSMGYIYEGIAYNVFSSQADSESSTGVIRFFDPMRGTHFYTANALEASLVSVNQPNWIREGVAWYV